MAVTDEDAQPGSSWFFGSELVVTLFADVQIAFFAVLILSWPHLWQVKFRA